MSGAILDGIIGTLLTFDKYGCWCDFPGNMDIKSRSEPVNDLDSACKVLHNNYECISMDHTCDPRSLTEDDYAIPLSALSPFDTSDVFTSCSNANTNSCGRDTCIAEINFFKTTLSPIYMGDADWNAMWADTTNMHSPDGTFDYSTQCMASGPPRTPTENTSSLACCGSYPFRTPFNTGRSVCCGENLEAIGSC